LIIPFDYADCGGGGGLDLVQKEFGNPAKGILVLSTLLFPPYLFVYDLPILIIPLACFWQEGLDKGRLWGDRPVLFLGWIMPLAGQMIWYSRIINEVKLQIGPVILLGCLIITLMRIKKYGMCECRSS